MNCSSCGKWILQRKTVYEDGSEVVNYEATSGKGHCQVLSLDTPPDFGCLSFEAGDHVVVTSKPGSPWHHWHHATCPDCAGRGSSVEDGVCQRCVGTGRVRHYDDGHVGDEKTQCHPNEKDKINFPDGPLPGTVLAPVKKDNVVV
jgi:hypothetical protein